MNNYIILVISVHVAVVACRAMSYAENRSIWWRHHVSRRIVFYQVSLAIIDVISPIMSSNISDKVSRNLAALRGLMWKLNIHPYNNCSHAFNSTSSLQNRNKSYGMVE